MKNNRKNRKKWRMHARRHFQQLVREGHIENFIIPKKWYFDKWPWPTEFDDVDYTLKAIPIVNVKCMMHDGQTIEVEYTPFLPEGCE